MSDLNMPDSLREDLLAVEQAIEKVLSNDFAYGLEDIMHTDLINLVQYITCRTYRP